MMFVNLTRNIYVNKYYSLSYIFEYVWKPYIKCQEKGSLTKCYTHKQKLLHSIDSTGQTFSDINTYIYIYKHFYQHSIS